MDDVTAQVTATWNGDVHQQSSDQAVALTTGSGTAAGRGITAAVGANQA